MIEINREQYQSIARQFDGAFADKIKSVFEKKRGDEPNGEVYADKAENPSVVLVICGVSINIGGDAGINKYDDNLVDFINNNVLREDEDIYLFLTSNEWEQKLKRLFASNIKFSKISYNHRLNKDKFGKHRKWREMIPDGYKMVAFDGSCDEFLEKHGKTRDFWNPESKRFGRALIKDDTEKIVSECFSFCFYCDNVVELGIETEEAYRSRGFAYLTSAAFIEYCLSINIEPNWHCYNIDMHSKALAEKLGFEEINNTRVFVL